MPGNFLDLDLWWEMTLVIGAKALIRSVWGRRIEKEQAWMFSIQMIYDIVMAQKWTMQMDYGLNMGYTNGLKISLSYVPLSGNESMVQTRSNSDTGNQPPPDPVAVQLADIAKKLESIDALQKDVATLKSQSHNRDRSSNGSGKQDEGDSSWHYQVNVS
ncbi:hypothetical protein Tco_1099451 [Tanacetum coccineum]